MAVARQFADDATTRSSGRYGTSDLPESFESGLGSVEDDGGGEQV
jgi:hypothetical protein